MFNPKRSMTFALAVILAAMAFAGCANNSGASSSAPAGANPAPASQEPAAETVAGGLEEVTLKFYFPGDEKSAKNEVLQAFYEQTKDTLNAKIELYFMPFGDYNDKMTALVSSGDNFDACYAADWLLYPQMSNRGAFLPLDEIMQQYAPSLYQYYQESGVVKACSINGQLMALPWTTKKSSKSILLYRDDLAKQYGVDTSNIATIEDVDRFLREAKEKVPDIIPFVASFAEGKDQSGAMCALFAKYALDRMDFHMFTLDLNESQPTIVPIEQTDMFRETVHLAKAWQDAGIIAKNELSSTDSNQFKNGQAFARMGIMEDALAFEFGVPGAVMGYADIYPDGKSRYDSPLNNTMVINKNAANPERVLRLMELLNNDQNAYDAFMYGIEGETYVLEGDTVMVPADEDPANPSYMNWFNWGFVRGKFDRPTQTRNREFLDKNNAWLERPNLVVSPALGFMPDTTDVKTEVAQRDQIYTEVGKLLWCGIVDGDVDTAVDRYIQQQKDAGLDKVIANIQAQLDAFVG